MVTTAPKMDSLGALLKQYALGQGVAVPDWALCELSASLRDPDRPDHGRSHFKTEETHPLWKFWIFKVIEATPFAPWFRAQIYIWGVFEYEIIKKAQGFMASYAAERRGQTFPCECPWEIEAAVEREYQRYKRRLELVGLPNSETMNTLANFEPRPGTEKMLAAAHNFVIEEGPRTLILMGLPGTGKSHIGYAVVYEAMERGEPSRFIGWGDLRELMLATFQRDNGGYSEPVDRATIPDLLVQYTGYKWLVIDDLGNGAPLTPWATEQLRTLLDKRFKDQDKRTIITTNVPVERFEQQFGAAVASRLKATNQQNEETPLQIVVRGKDQR